MAKWASIGEGVASCGVACLFALSACLKAYDAGGAHAAVTGLMLELGIVASEQGVWTALRGLAGVEMAIAVVILSPSDRSIGLLSAGVMLWAYMAFLAADYLLMGGASRCGCLPGVLDTNASHGILRNAVLLMVVAAARRVRREETCAERQFPG